MNRRDFLKQLALISMGPIVAPDFQLDAFVDTLDRNCPKVPNLVAIHDISIVGLARTSRPVLATILRGDEKLQHLGLNLFGGIYRWVAPSQAPYLFSSLKDLKFQIAEHPHGAFVHHSEFNLSIYGYDESMMRKMWEWDWDKKEFR